METVMNAYHIKVNKMCASCKHKECMSDGSRVCQKMGLKVEQRYCCRHWEMNDGLKNAGLQNGGVVRLKAAIEREQCQACLSNAEREQARCGNIKGTAEIIIR